MIGLNVDSDALHYGKIPSPGIGKRFITLRNQGDFDMEVSIGIDAEFSSWVKIPKNYLKFIIKANETIEVPISVEIPVNAELKEYKGNLIVLFKRA